MVLPAISVITLLFWQGIFQGLLESFGLKPLVGKSKFTLDIYKEVFASDYFTDSFFMTIKITILSTILAGILALLILYLIFITSNVFSPKYADILQKLLISPMLVPYLIGGYIISTLLMQSGFLSALLYSLGIISAINEFPILTNEVKGYSIIITYIWKTTPFIILMIYPVFQRIQDNWKDVALVYGAGKRKFFLEIIIPLITPSFITSLFIIFAFIFSAFEVPYLLGVTYPKMLSVLSFDMYSKGFIEQRPQLMAINIIITLVTIVLGILLYFFNCKYITKGRSKW
jgi:putative spermidine/putrescine transport system permease protein